MFTRENASRIAAEFGFRNSRSWEAMYQQAAEMDGKPADANEAVFVTPQGLWDVSRLFREWCNEARHENEMDAEQAAHENAIMYGE